LHGGAGSFSFADGHAEIKKWLGPFLGRMKFVQGGGFRAALPSAAIRAISMI